MQAIVFTRYGPPDVLRLAEVEKPDPADDEVLIKVHATSVTTAECMMRRGEPLWGRVIIGLRKPRRRMRRLGNELSGEVESVGKDVQRFRKGDQVFGFTGFGVGAYAQYKCMPEKGSLALKPVNKPHDEAVAAVDGASTALYFLRDKASVRPGQRVLVIGASGSIGSYAVQLAKYFGADVTAVCSARNRDLVRSLGADTVIDYARTDFTKNGQTYDVIFDTVGKSSFSRCRNSLTDRGCYLPTTGLMNLALMLWTSRRGGKRVLSGMSVEKNEALVLIKELIETDRLRIVVDRRYPLAEMAEAHRYVESGRKVGNVVVTVDHE